MEYEKLIQELPDGNLYVNVNRWGDWINIEESGSKFLPLPPPPIHDTGADMKPPRCDPRTRSCLDMFVFDALGSIFTILIKHHSINSIVISPRINVCCGLLLVQAAVAPG